jgi:hypothetical protein
VREDGTDVIIASIVDPAGLIQDDEQMANALLIANAPKLYAAALRALEYLTDHGIDLDGEPEELVAGIRRELEEALARDRPEVVDQERGVMTLEAIAREPWAAVDKAIPEAPSDELLRLAREAAARCRETAEHDMLAEPDPDDIFPVQKAYLEKRFGAAAARLAALDEIVHTREQAREPMTIEAIERDPWNAVKLDLPREMAADFAFHVVDTCYQLRNEAAANVYHGRDPDGRWEVLYDQADARREEALVAYDIAKAREAWQAGEFSRATIEADPWTAVYLEIPYDADLTLLTEAQKWARDLVQYAAPARQGTGALAEPLVTLPFNTPDHQAAATARAAELEERVRNQLLRQIEINNHEGATFEAAPMANQNNPGRIALAATQEGQPTPEAERTERDVWNAYVRDCGEAYQRYGFSFDRVHTERGTDTLINSLTVPEPQNAIEHAALKGWLDGIEKQIGFRPEIVFEPTPARPEIAPEAGHTPELLTLDERMAAIIEQPTEATPSIGEVWDRAIETGKPPIDQAIKRDPWNAVMLDIPPHADAETLGLIAETAQALRIHAEERAAAATSIEQTEHWNELAGKADQRFETAYLMSYDAPAREAAGAAVQMPEPAASEPEPTRIRAGGGDDRASGEQTIYDRYPGLTHDEGGNDGRAQDEAREFDDPGIERSR